LVGETSTKGPGIHALEKHFTPDELGEIWHVSPNTVRGWCEDFGGCLVIDRPEKLHKQRYRTVRIPESTMIKIYERHFLRRAA
jgi:hypothetical protein